jgi:erythromycin esterase
MNNELLKKEIAVGIIFLVIIIGVHPVFAIDTKYSIINQYSEKDFIDGEESNNNLIKMESLLNRFDVNSKPQISESEGEEKDNIKRGFGSSIEVNGEVELIKTLFNLPVFGKSFILYMSIQFIDNSDITVKVDSEVFEFDFAGKMQFIGFFGIYSSNQGLEENTGKPFINLNGRAIYVKIEGKKYQTVDDSYLPIVNSLDNITHSLDKSPLELSDEDLESLLYLSDCKIVGLGEATHGTKEFFQLKHRIFKYLVENHNYSIFAFECDMGESYYVDKFVTEGEGNIDEIMIYMMHFWTWRTEEVKDLLLWMREYNEDKSDEDKIHFIGVDCQFLTYQADIIIDYFDRTGVSLPEEFLNFLNEIDQITPDKIYNHYLEMSINKKEEIDQNVDNLLTKFEESKDELISASSEFEYQFIKRIALNIKQVNDFYYNYTHDEIANRDFYMAQNTVWTSDLFGNNNKVAVWAHNMHNMNHEFLFGTGTMGFYLKEELNDNYQIIDFAFSFGSFTAVKMDILGNYIGFGTNYITRHPFFGSINYVFHHGQDENFILRESDISAGSDFDIWISKPQKFLDIGAVFNGNSYFYYHTVEFKNHYDILIYWDKTNASELLIPQTHYFCNNIFPMDIV